MPGTSCSTHRITEDRGLPISPFPRGSNRLVIQPLSLPFSSTYPSPPSLPPSPTHTTFIDAVLESTGNARESVSTPIHNKGGGWGVRAIPSTHNLSPSLRETRLGRRHGLLAMGGGARSHSRTERRTGVEPVQYSTMEARARVCSLLVWLQSSSVELARCPKMVDPIQALHETSKALVGSRLNRARRDVTASARLSALGDPSTHGTRG